MLKSFISYIHFYLEVMATSENVSLLYHLAHKGKTVRDPESQGASQVSSHSYVPLYLHTHEPIELLCDMRARPDLDQRSSANTLMAASKLSWQDQTTRRHPEATTER